MSPPISRRQLIAGIAAGAALGRGRARAAERQRIALVGTGVRGVGLWGRTLLRDDPDVVEMVGLCDVNPGRLESAGAYVGAVPFRGCLMPRMRATSPSGRGRRARRAGADRPGSPRTSRRGA